MRGGGGGGGRRGLRGFRSGCIEISLEVAETLGFGFIGRDPPLKVCGFKDSTTPLSLR